MAAQPRTFKSGATVFTEGDVSNSIFIVKKGILAIRKKKGSGYVEMGRIHQGEVIGEMGFFDRKPRSATIVCDQDAELIEIDFESLDKIYQPVPDYIKSIVNALVDRLRRANETIRKLQDVKYAGKGGGGDGGDSSGSDDLQAALNATAGDKK